MRGAAKMEVNFVSRGVLHLPHLLTDFLGCASVLCKAPPRPIVKPKCGVCCGVVSCWSLPSPLLCQTLTTPIFPLLCYLYLTSEGKGEVLGWCTRGEGRKGPAEVRITTHSDGNGTLYGHSRIQSVSCVRQKYNNTSRLRLNRCIDDTLETSHAA